MSIRQQIVDRVAARLATVTGFTGTGKVSEWRTTPFAVGDLPAMTFSDTTDTPEPPAYGVIRHQLSVTVEILAEGATSVDTMRTYMQTVLTAVGTDPTWKNTATPAVSLATTTRLITVELATSQTDRLLSAARIEIIITYETANWAM